MIDNYSLCDNNYVLVLGFSHPKINTVLQLVKIRRSFGRWFRGHLAFLISPFKVGSIETDGMSSH